jgi:exonuclease III
MNIIKIATLNINGIYTPTRIAMLHDFLKSHALDIQFLQKITHPNFDNLPGYTNVGTTMRGTAFVTRNDLQVTNITKLPTGRGIAAECEGIALLNVYAPSWTAKKAEREAFFNTGLVYLLRNAPENLLLGGDFNCVLDATDATGTCTYSRTLAVLVQGCALRDVWTQSTARRTYTHYSMAGAKRIDRCYVTPSLYQKIVAAETVVAPFTDHHVVILNPGVDVSHSWQGKGFWKLHADLIHDPVCTKTLCHEWKRWKHQQRYFPDTTL